MRPKRTTLVDAGLSLLPGAKASSASRQRAAAPAVALRFVIVTMDTHLASALERARPRLASDFPGLRLSLHAASEFDGNAELLKRCQDDIAQADILVLGMLFLEDHFVPILPALQARREECDALIALASASEVVKLTRAGSFDMGKPASGPMALLQRLRGKKTSPSAGGASQMRMLRRIPQLLRFIPGGAQDVRAYFMALQYWLGGSDENMLNLVRSLIDRYADGPRRVLRGRCKPQPPQEYPDVGVYHPRMKGRLSERSADLPGQADTAQDDPWAQGADHSVMRQELLLLIEAEIAALPTRQREAFLLRYWEEFDVNETAQIMGCSQGSVKTHCSRAVQSLANSLKSKGISL